MISSQSNATPKEIAVQEPIYFVSPNFEGKMNDYLNMVLKKSQEDHNTKLQQMSENEMDNRARASNIFMRKMKV